MVSSGDPLELLYSSNKKGLKKIYCTSFSAKVLIINIGSGK